MLIGVLRVVRDTFVDLVMSVCLLRQKSSETNTIDQHSSGIGRLSVLAKSYPVFARYVHASFPFVQTRVLFENGEP